ncbi:hypothetical protein C8R45DRAFT_1008220 [Mycena sanguinolenta]|nr:hypothetical protein C8R45DRAFT_1008220 [Mycena sanguinolenta]
MIGRCRWPAKVGVRPIKLSKRAALRKAAFMRSIGFRTARVLKTLDLVLQLNRREREQRPKLVLVSSVFGQHKSDVHSSDSDSDEEEDEVADELLEKPDTPVPERPYSPPRTHRSSVLSHPPPHLSRTTARAARTPEEIQRMRWGYFLMQMRRYRGRWMVEPTDPDVEDIHLGFRPPHPEDEPHLDMNLRLTLFNIMMRLGRKENVELLHDAIVFRNTRDESKEVEGGVKAKGEKKLPEPLRLWNRFITVWTKLTSCQ